MLIGLVTGEGEEEEGEGKNHCKVGTLWVRQLIFWVWFDLGRLFRETVSICFSLLKVFMLFTVRPLFTINLFFLSIIIMVIFTVDVDELMLPPLWV